MTESPALRNEVDLCFAEYFQTFIDIGAGTNEARKILAYWGVPLHTSGPQQSQWLTTPEEVVNVLTQMQKMLKDRGYTHTVAIDKRIVIYSENASRVETIMSRRRGDGEEMDRAAVSFELRRQGSGGGWIIVSTAARPTDESRLQDVW